MHQLGDRRPQLTFFKISTSVRNMSKKSVPNNPSLTLKAATLSASLNTVIIIVIEFIDKVDYVTQANFTTSVSQKCAASGNHFSKNQKSLE